MENCMIPFADIEKYFAIEHDCTEIEFNVDRLPDYQYCRMGKMWHPMGADDEYVYWFELFSDGSKNYEYDSFADFSNAPVFDGKSLKEIWDSVELLSVDDMDPEERVRSMIS